MESHKRDKGKGLKRNSTDNKEERKCSRGSSSGSDIDGCNGLCSPSNNNGNSSRKKLRLEENIDPLINVSPPVVFPRSVKRLRSAINKHRSQPTNSIASQPFRGKMLEEPTEDEEEVAEALISISKSVEEKEGNNNLEKNVETKEATFDSLSKAPEGVGTKFLAPCNGAKDISTENIDIMPSSKLDQSTDASVNLKEDMRCLLVEATSMEHDQQSSKERSERITDDLILRETLLETDADDKTVLHNGGREQMTMPSSKAVVRQISTPVSGIPAPTDEKFWLAPVVKKQRLSKCSTHVTISYSIKNHQNEDEKHTLMLNSNNQLKAEEGTPNKMPKFTVPSSSNASQEKYMQETNIKNLQDARLLQAQQAAALSRAYALQKQACDGDKKSSVDIKKHNVSYTPNQAAVVPYLHSQDSYNPQYQEQLAAGSTQQVQMQLPPHFIANANQLYGPQMTKQQQQQYQQHYQLMYAAHMTQFRLNMYPISLQQNSQLQQQRDSSVSSHYPSYFPINMNQPYRIPFPSSPMPSHAKSKQSPQIICSAESLR